ncbi:hypothetical protein KY385_00210 [Candidatus Parcubacteria bacterium]|nr:hypothetical protein [Candidatus Parcubacteria bacterium]
MNKRKLHHQYKKVRVIKPWYFLAASLIFLAVGVYGLRQNNFEALKLRDEVIKADEQNGDIEGALRDLRQHTYSHMNAELSSGPTTIKQPIQLKNRYEKLVAADAKKVKAKNVQVQKTAENICGQRYPAAGFNSSRVACVVDYVGKNAATESNIPPELYKFDFVSPAWTADKTGLSLLAAGFLFMVFILRLAVGWWYKYEL